MAYFHKINLVHKEEEGFKVNLDHVLYVTYDNKALNVVLDNGEKITFREGISVENVEKEFNRFPA